MVMKALSELVIRLVATHDPKGFKKLDKNMDKSTRKAKKFGRSMRSAVSGIRRDLAGLAAGLGAGLGVANLVETAKHMDRIKARFDVVAKSQEESNKLMEKSSKIAEGYGLNLRTVELGFTGLLASMKGTNFTTEDGVEMFDNLSRAVAGMRMPTADANGALLAFGQIISKGKVQAEELRRQLANRLPGAFPIAAKALNMTSVELDRALRDGAVTSEALVKIAKGLAQEFGKNAEGVAKTTIGSLNRMQNAFDAFGRRIIGKGFEEFLIDTANSITEFLKTDEVNAFADAIGELFKNLNKLFNLIKENRKDIQQWLTAVSIIASLVAFLPVIIKIAGWIAFIGKLILEFGFLQTVGLLLWNISFILKGIVLATMPLWVQVGFFIAAGVIIGDLLYTIITYLTTGEAKGLLWVNAFKTLSNVFDYLKRQLDWIFNKLSEIFKFKGVMNFGIGGSFGGGQISGAVSAVKSATQASQIRNNTQSSQVNQTNNINVENYGGNEQKITESIIDRVPISVNPSVAFNMGAA